MKKIIISIFTSLFALNLFSQVENPLDVLSQEVIVKPIANYIKLQKAGELKNSKVLYPKSTASEEEKKIAKENNQAFQNYEREIEKANQAISRDDIPDLIFYYTYKIKAEDLSNGNGFNQLAAKLDQRQGTLASINGFDSPDALKAGMTILLPVFQGLFIPENPESDFEILLKKEYENEIEASKEDIKVETKVETKTEKKSPEQAKKTQSNQKEQPKATSKAQPKQQKKSTVKKVEVQGKKYNYLPGKTMSPTSKAFFESQKQGDKMILPLSRKVLTSPFGYRTSPISGKWKLHAGIDLAAPTGTDVYACKSGKVIESGYNEIYGNYIIIRHEDKKTSTYAHLSKRLVERNVNVKTGAIIGKVGTTGASTGPHLHFEIRENGKATDPAKYL